MPPAPGSLTAQEAVRRAVEHSPSIQAALREALAMESGVRAARALANPEITVAPGFTKAGSDEELLVRQPLEINGTRAARAGVASARARAAKAEAVRELRETVYRTKHAYYGLARARERLALTGDLSKSADELDAYAARQVELGSRPGVERTQTRIEAARARQQLERARADHADAQTRLNVLMGLPGDAPLSLADMAVTRQEIDEDALLRAALPSRAEFAVSEANRQAYLQEARLARAEGLPDIAPHFRAESVSREPREGGFGIGISIPIFDHGGRRNRIRQAEESARAQEQRSLALWDQVRMEVQQAVARLRAAERIVASYQNGLLDDSRRLLESSRTGFRLGQTNVVSLLEAQRTYRAVQTEYIDALADHEQALAEIERAAGSVPESQLPPLRHPEAKPR
ncbi:MAG TPA: TolC family protein [Fimbriimonas sp.]